jgi:serine/threonine protein kinase
MSGSRRLHEALGEQLASPVVGRPTAPSTLGHVARSHPLLSPSRLPWDSQPFTSDDFTARAADIEMGPKLAAGAFGSVFRGTYAGQVCAVKILYGVEVFDSNDWLSEVTILKNYCTKHPNLIAYLGAAKVRVDGSGFEDRDDGGGDEDRDSAAASAAASFAGGHSPLSLAPPERFNVYLLTSLATHGDLRRFWTTSELVSLQGPACGGWRLVLKLLAGAHSALVYLHQNRVIHRDVKTTNIVVNDKLESQLCDFGMARFDVNRCAEDLEEVVDCVDVSAGGAGAGGGGGGGGADTTPPPRLPKPKLRPTPKGQSALKRKLSVVGTSEFMAPEIIFEEPYDSRCDTFSFGVRLCGLLVALHRPCTRVSFLLFLLLAMLALCMRLFLCLCAEFLSD